MSSNVINISVGGTASSRVIIMNKRKIVFTGTGHYIGISTVEGSTGDSGNGIFCESPVFGSTRASSVEPGLSRFRIRENVWDVCTPLCHGQSPT